MVAGQPFKAYITDLDGTLCNTIKANIVAYTESFKDAKLEFDSDLYVTSFGLRFDEMMNIMTPNATEEQLEIVKSTKAEHYRRNMGLIKPNELLIDMLKTAKQSGIPIGLATTARETNARAVLEHLKIDDLFDVLIFGEQVLFGKPDPECYNLVISSLGVKPKECLIFEDSTVGIEAAKSSGAHVLRVKA